MIPGKVATLDRATVLSGKVKSIVRFREAKNAIRTALQSEVVVKILGAVKPPVSLVNRHKTVPSKPCLVGLYHDDCLYENSDVQEALRRLPQSITDDRNFRMQRALHLSLTKKILPKEEWISYEEDRAKGRYLQPYLEEVIRERKEREEWNKK
ncbi:Cytochrome b-c1 complex subunit 7 [Portunus trituberculatus]|uniref:Cytochrome b-c1 complex subunit 7 n=1 Tax=Portunus trituberculatus TaxID=210409 RepID=A0A5B7CRE3_PORTR|nr:Cytochrome b-c1 complex subunit 7 [Portunus trituberculatus]